MSDLAATNDPELLFLGIGSEEIDPTTFDGDITLTLKGVSGPGEFSLYSIDAFGAPVVEMATSDGITAADAVTVLAGSHAHYNFAFTAIGRYAIDFEATASLPGGTATSSGIVTYFFRVQNVLTTEHVDVGVEFEDGEPGLHLHRRDEDNEYEPDGATISPRKPRPLNRPAHSGTFWAPGPATRSGCCRRPRIQRCSSSGRAPRKSNRGRSPRTSRPTHA